jgi:hypothetical protein
MRQTMSWRSGCLAARPVFMLTVPFVPIPFLNPPPVHWFQRVCFMLRTELVGCIALGSGHHKIGSCASRGAQLSALGAVVMRSTQ